MQPQIIQGDALLYLRTQRAVFAQQMLHFFLAALTRTDDSV